MLRKLTLISGLGGIALALCAMLLTRRGDLVDHFGDCRRGAATPTWEHLDQGWDSLEEWRFWYTSQGSQMLPYSWFLALEQVRNGKAFSTPEHLASFGFVPAPRSRCNPDALPLGFTRDISTQALGLSCAACHTRLIRTGNRRLLINGAPAEIHFNRFVRALAEALEHAQADPAVWRRFVARVAPNASPNASEKLRTEVVTTGQSLRQFQHFVSADAADDGEFAGFGRVDAFGAIFNRVTVDALGVPANYAPADAPMNYPYLWGASRLGVTQWNGSAPNRVPFGPLARNLGEAIGLFGGVALVPDQSLGFRSPVKVANLHALEAVSEKLRAPAWSTAKLPPIDEALAHRGYDIYNSQCRQCHAMPRPAQGDNRAEVIDVDAVGTDAVAARNYIDRQAQTGILAGQRKWLLSGERYGEMAPTRELVVTAIVGVIVGSRLDSIAPQDLASLFRERPPADVAGYKARPLEGIWATAPYLHNGSVPTLADLLEPPDKRPTIFRSGVLSFDPVRVGLGREIKGAPNAEFDTRLRGNANSGHRYGTDLSSDDKRALLEFLKSL